MELLPRRAWRDILSIRDEMARMWEQMNRMFEDFFVTRKEEKVWTPAVDVLETEDEVIINAELPGIQKEHLQISLEEGSLTIKGERKFEAEIKREDFHQKERFEGSFLRTIPLPPYLVLDKASAKYKDGVLQIKIPKTEKRKKRELQIEIE